MALWVMVVVYGWGWVFQRSPAEDLPSRRRRHPAGGCRHSAEGDRRLEADPCKSDKQR